jgi:2-keto-4-pentenoate hydratase
LLSDTEVAEAAALLLDVRAGRLALAGLPEELTPANTADVQRIINLVSEHIDAPVRGWKTYTVYKPMHPPIYAPIYELYPSGSRIPADISPHRLIEPEIMVRVDRALPARDQNYDVLEIMQAVTAIVGFEVIGPRLGRPSASGDSPQDGQGSLYSSFADHIANGCIVVGDDIPDWRMVAFEDIPLRLTENDRELASVIGCHPFDNPFLPVVVGINRLRRHRGVNRGDIIVTNSSTSFFPVSAGSLIRASYEGLGEVSAVFEES